jgi:multiple sugar transport system substrate-binding protein
VLLYPAKRRSRRVSLFLESKKEKGMKRTTALTVALLVLFSFSSFCAFARKGEEKGKPAAEGKKEKPAEAETITVLMGIDAAGKNMKKRVAEFEQQTGIRVNLIEVEWDAMVNKQALALTVQEPTYDIVDCRSFMLAEYVPSGLYEDITDLFPPDVKATYIDGIVEAVTIDGKVYAAPLMASWMIMFYNTQIFKEAGLDPNKPPKTWVELSRYAKFIQNETTYAFADSLAPGEYITVAFFRWAKSAGAKIHEWKGNRIHWLLDSQECIDAAYFMKRMIEEGTMDPVSPTYYPQQLAELFGKGHCAMFVNWDMMQLAFKDLAQSPYAGKIKTAPVPGIREGLFGSVEGHEFMAVPSPSLHKQAARKFIKFVTSVENVRRRAIEQGMTPVYRELFNDPEVKKAIDLDTIFHAAANCYYRPSIPEYSEISDIISTELQNILVNNKDPKTALQEANARANALVGW